MPPDRRSTSRGPDRVHGFFDARAAWRRIRAASPSRRRTSRARGFRVLVAATADAIATATHDRLERTQSDRHPDTTTEQDGRSGSLAGAGPDITGSAAGRIRPACRAARAPRGARDEAVPGATEEAAG